MGPDQHIDQTEKDLWRSLLNAQSYALALHGVLIDQTDLAPVTKMVLEHIEAKGFRIVPLPPTRKMVAASQSAMRDQRLRAGWVSDKTKHRWRLRAAIAAAPSWRAAALAQVLARTSASHTNP
jgi:hypothetical protein